MDGAHSTPPPPPRYPNIPHCPLHKKLLAWEKSYAGDKYWLYNRIPLIASKSKNLAPGILPQLEEFLITVARPLFGRNYSADTLELSDTWPSR